jgi:hypothetical protein
MIKFTLKCAGDHRFDSWFQSAEAFDKLNSANMVMCETCGDTSIEKALMAPSVQSDRTDTARQRPLQASGSPAEKALAELKRQIEENSDYVGMDFAREARDMHDGLVPERPIYGEARPDEARQLIEDGVPVRPLPFRPARKTN